MTQDSSDEVTNKVKKSIDLVKRINRIVKAHDLESRFPEAKIVATHISYLMEDGVKVSYENGNRVQSAELFLYSLNVGNDVAKKLYESILDKSFTEEL